MDLSKTAKRNRDAVEAAQLPTERLIDYLQEIITRMDATRSVWHETARTLAPGIEKANQALAEVERLHKSLEELHRQGCANKWK